MKTTVPLHSFRRQVFAKFLLFTVLLLGCSSLVAQTNTWDGSSSNNWNTANNWSLNQVPTALHDVVIPNGITSTININTAAVCKSFTMNSGNTANTVSITAGNSLQVTNAVSIGAGTGSGDNKIFAVGAGTLTCASINISATGNSSRTSELTLSTGTVNVTGNISMNDANNYFRFTSNGNLFIGGNITGGNLIPSTGTVTCNGSTAQVISGATTSSFYNLVINKSAQANTVASNSQACSIANDLTVTTGTFNLNATNTDYTIGGDVLIQPNGILNHAVNYSATLRSLNVAGQWTLNGGVFSPGTGRVQFNGSVAQVLGGTSNTGFNQLVVNNNAGISLNNINISVNGGTGALVFTNGKLTTGSGRVILGTTTTTSGANASRYIIGNLDMQVSTGNISKTFDIGDATFYAPVTLALNNVTSSGSILAFTTGSEHPNITSSNIDESRNVTRYWNFTPSGIAFSSYNAVLNYQGANIDAGATATSFIGGLYTGGWSYPTVSSVTSTSISLTGLTTMGAMVAGEGGTFAPTLQTHPTNQSICVNASSSFTAVANNKPSSTVQWQISTNSGLTYNNLVIAAPYAVSTNQVGTTTSSVLTINPSSLALNGNMYRAVFTNSRGTATSNGATLGVTDVTTASAGPNQTICIATSATLAANTPVVGAGVWSIISGPSTNLAQISNTTNPTATFTPVGAAGTYQLRWTITNGTCSSNSTVNITTVNPPAAPVISFSNFFSQTSQTIMVCGPVDIGGQNDIDFYGYTPPSGATFNWQYSTNSGAWTNSGISATSQNYPIASFAGTPGTHQFRVVMTTSAGCVVTSNIVTLVVNPASSIGGTSLNACSGAAFSTSFSGFPSGTLFSWGAPVVTGGMTGGSFGFMANSLSGTLVNNTAFTQTATYTVTPVYLAIAPSCSMSFQVVVSVFPYPAINTASSATSVCYKATAQTTTLNYSSTAGSPNTYSISWNASPANSFAAVTNAVLPVSPITINVPAGTNPGVYTGNITVKNASGCTSLSKSFTVTIHALPTIAASSSAVSVCKVDLDQTSSLSYSGTTGSPTNYSITWSSAPPNNFPNVTNAALPASPISLLIPGGSQNGNYSGLLTVSNANGCVSNPVSFNMHIKPMPITSWSASAAPVCVSSSAQTTTLTYSTTSNSPNSYSIIWSPVPSNSFTNISDASFSGSASGGVINITVPANTAAGTYTANVIVKNSNGCSSNAFNFTLDVINSVPAQASSITGLGETCDNVTGLSYSIPAASGAASYQWNLPTGWQITSGAGTTSILVNANAGSQSGLVQVSGVNACGAGPVSQIPVTVNTKGTWLGINSNWHNASNWCGGIPDLNTDVIIPAGRPYYPVITTAPAQVRNLTVVNGASLTVTSNTLRVAGSITSSGNIDLTQGELELKGTLASQFVSGSMFVQQTILKLLLSNSNGVSLSGVNDSLKISEKLYFGASNVVLTTNGNLVLLSRADKTASVADLTQGGLYSNNNISGFVTVERYIPNHAKAWQFLSIPTVGQTINQAWQEGNAPLANSKPGYGTIITGNLPSATTLGFDIGTSLASGPGMKSYNATTGLWDGISSTNMPIANSKGYMLFVRGDRSVTAFNQAPTATILRTSGKLYTTGLDAPPVINIGADQFASVGNPYASAIDFSKLSRTGGVQDVFYVWDPILTTGGGNSYGLGAYQTFVGTGSGYMVVPGGGSYVNGNTRIESGSAFFVRSVGTPGTISFSEPAKVDGSNLVTRGSAQRNVQQIKLNLSVLNNGNPILLDGAIAQFDPSWSSDIDMQDVRKITGQGTEQIGIITPEGNYVVERRGAALVSDTLQYQVNQLKRQSYRLDIETSMFSATGLQPYLEDRYLRRIILLNPQGTSSVDFTVDAQPGSSAPSRFRIFFRSTRSVFTAESVSKTQSPTVTVKANLEEAASIHIYPNPVVNKNMHVQFRQFPAGSYQLSLMGQHGQVFMTQELKLSNENNTQLIQLPASLSSGSYQLVVMNINGLKKSTTVIIP